MKSETFFQGRQLKNGYTTGTCAAAAAKAAALCLRGEAPDSVEIRTAAGMLTIPIADRQLREDGCQCTVIKYAGDDPDVTDGLEICAHLTYTQDGMITIDGGKGVGRITRAGMKTPIGSAAINPGPLRMIEEAVSEVLPQEKGARVIISVPQGEAVAAQTFNPCLGIVGGISILGTTGIVRPMSEEAFKESLALELDMLAVKHKRCAFVFGEQGRQLAIRAGVPESLCMMTSNFLGYLLDYAKYRGFTEILLIGQIGKLGKVAAGVFQTHSRVADARMETLAAFAAMEGADRDTVCRIYDCLTTAQAVDILDENGLSGVYQKLADRVRERVMLYEAGAIKAQVMLYTDTGRLLAETDGARNLIGQLAVDYKEMQE